MAWAWQLLSSLSVTVPPEKPEHQPPEVVSGSCAKHLPRAEQERAAEQGRGGTSASPSAPNLPAPGNHFRSPSLAPRPGKRAQGCRAEREPGLGGQGGAWHWVPQWESPRGTVPRGKAGNSPRAGTPQASLCSGSRDTDRWWLLSQTWALAARLL